MLEIHEDSHRVSRYVPPSYPEPESALGSLDSPVLPKQRILTEVRVGIGIHPHVRTDKNMMSLQL